MIIANQESNETKASEFNNQGYELAEAGHWQEAIDCYQEALRLNPPKRSFLNEYGECFKGSWASLRSPDVSGQSTGD